MKLLRFIYRLGLGTGLVMLVGLLAGALLVGIVLLVNALFGGIIYF